jgi:hypothetical protein
VARAPRPYPAPARSRARSQPCRAQAQLACAQVGREGAGSTKHGGADFPRSLRLEDQLCVELYTASRAMTARYRPQRRDDERAANVVLTEAGEAPPTGALGVPARRPTFRAVRIRSRQRQVGGLPPYRRRGSSRTVSAVLATQGDATT